MSFKKEADAKSRFEQIKKRKRERKKKFDPLSIVLLIIGVGLIGFGLWKLLSQQMDYSASNKVYQEVAADFVVTQEADQQSQGMGSVSQVPWYQMITVDMEGLQDYNQDVCGWLFFENEDISYPILYSGDDSTYLRTAIDHTSATAGCIFMEGQNHPDFGDSHTILYGHNMRNLSMFGKLKYYKDTEGYYQDHQYFQIVTADAVYRYRIFAYEDISEDSFIYNVSYTGNTAFTDFVKEIRADSLLDTDLTIGTKDKIITLSTCSKTADRFVVCGVRVETHYYD